VREQNEAFIEDFARVRPPFPAARFRMHTLLVHTWRRFSLLDPDLLLDGWPRNARDLIHQRRAGYERRASCQPEARSYFAELEDGRSGRAAEAA